jgi:hypothetical protein
MAVIINDLEVVLPTKSEAQSDMPEQGSLERRQAEQSPLTPTDLEHIECHLQQRALRVAAH